MSNGGKRVVFNTRERVISNDYNRLQEMVSQARAAAMARLHNDTYSDGTPGYAAQISTGGQTPMVADVFGGLFVKVDDASNLFVDPGVVGVVDPDSPVGLDDEIYKVVDDPGLSTAGVLTHLVNASGSIRIDLVVADVVMQVLETDSRDIFDPSTGLFTAQTVNKVMSKRLSYEMVRGTPGAGMPTFTNRIVLAVASVPDGTVDWSDCTFWDVRPLVADRIHHVKRDSTSRRYYDFDFFADNGVHKGFAYTEYGGYLAGGRLMASVPGVGDVEFDAKDAENSTTNDGYVDGGTPDFGANPVFLLFPSGLPRWARYSVGTAPGLAIRAPYGTLGILTAGRKRAGVEDYLKADEWGNATGVSVPVSTGLTGTADGVLLYMAHVEEHVSFASVIDALGVGRRIKFPWAAFSGSPPHAATGNTGTINPQDTLSTVDVEANWWDAGEIGLPRSARAVSMRFQCPGLEVHASAAPPLDGYDRIMFYARQNLRDFRVQWTHYGLGDGTGIVPDIDWSSDFELPIDRSASPVVMRVQLDDPSGSGGVAFWRFADNADAYAVTGYEL